MNEILLLFILFTITALLAWSGKYRLSIFLFVLFLLLATYVFLQDITTQLHVQL